MCKPLAGAAVALILAGCGAASSLPQSTSFASSVPATTSKNTLIYVSEGGTNTVAMLKNPSLKAAGKLGGLHDPTGVCSNAAGDVWVVNEKASTVIEYPHDNHKSISTLNDSAATVPYACSVDPTTGNLAVTSVNGQKGGGGGVLIYTSAKGSPVVRTSSTLFVALFCAYDAGGNLFVDGLNSDYSFVLMEIPSGGTQLESITVNGTIGYPGGIAWDGTYLAVGDDAYEGGRSTAVDDLTVSGTSATIKAAIPLPGSCDVMQFAIVGGNKLIAPDACLNKLFVYAYPTGGKATKTLSNFQFPAAVAISP